MQTHLAMTDSEDLTNVTDIDSNQMGIKSVKLFDWLQSLCVGKKLSSLNNDKNQKKNSNSISHEMLPLLIDHFTNEIPLELFTRNKDTDAQRQRLVQMGRYLEDNFISTDNLPFTIVRICELCFDPFKYFKINELYKFVNAMEKCCVVKCTWNDNSSSSNSSGGGGESNNKENSASASNYDEDVSLSKIPFVNASTVTREYNEFFKEIDSIMSVNFDYDDEDDEEDDDEEEEDHIKISIQNDDDDDDNDAITYEKRKKKKSYDNGNTIIEEYYEDDDDEDDEDYVLDDTEGQGNTCTSTNPVHDDTKTTTPRKRKPMELDNYEYDSTNVSPSKNTPSKKSKSTDEIVLSSPNESASNNRNGSDDDKIRGLNSP